jgi:lysophospholipase L1-like esterase
MEQRDMQLRSSFGERQFHRIRNSLVTWATITGVAMLLFSCDGMAADQRASDAGPLSLTLTQGKPLRVLFAGDSLTGGYFASDQAHSFPALVKQRLGNVKETYPGLSNQKLTTVGRITEVPADLDLAVLELGTNDVGIPTALDVFRQQYGDLVARIRRRSPNVVLLCAGTWTGNGHSYDAVIRSVCASAGGRYVELHDIYARPGTRGPAGVLTKFGLSDTFHPNDEGHRFIANALLAGISLRSNRLDPVRHG